MRQLIAHEDSGYGVKANYVLRYTQRFDTERIVIQVMLDS